MFLRNFFVLAAFTALIGCNSQSTSDDPQALLSTKTVSADELTKFNQTISSELIQEFSGMTFLGENGFYSSWGRIKQLEFLTVSGQEQDLYQYSSPLLANTELAGYSPYLSEYFKQLEQTAYLTTTSQSWLAMQNNYPFLPSFKNAASDTLTDIEIVDFYLNLENVKKARSAELSSSSYLSLKEKTRLYWFDSFNIEFGLENLSPKALQQRLFQNTQGDIWEVNSVELSGELQIYQTDNVKMVNLLPSTTDWQLLVIQAKPAAFASVQDNLLNWLTAFSDNKQLQLIKVELPEMFLFADDNPDLNFALEGRLYENSIGFGEDNRITGKNLTYLEDSVQNEFGIDAASISFNFTFESALTELEGVNYFGQNGGVINAILHGNGVFKPCDDRVIEQIDLYSTFIVLKKADAVLSVAQFDLPSGDALDLCNPPIISSAYELPTPSVNL